MARYRSRSRSYSPRRSRTPPRRRRFDDRSRPSRSYRDRRSPAPSGLLVRNIALDARSLMFLLFESFFLLVLFGCRKNLEKDEKWGVLDLRAVVGFENGEVLRFWEQTSENGEEILWNFWKNSS